jgi:hypothetical protein
MISIGRSVLLFGSRDEIAERIAKFRKRGRRKPSDDDNGTFLPDDDVPAAREHSLEFGLAWDEDDELQAAFLTMEPPELPQKLSPCQAAQLAELIDYLHIRLRQLIGTVETDRRGQRVTLEFGQWQELLDLQSRLADYSRRIGDPSRD